MKIKINKEVHDKVMYWVKKASFEVSGFGTVTWDEESKEFMVLDACLLEQEGGAAHTDIDPTALSKLMYHVHKNKIPGELKWWWHSHVKMDVFWSGTDKDTIKDLGKNGWCVATVFNHKEESRSAYCTVTEVPLLGEQTYFVDDLKLEVVYPAGDQEIVKEWDKQFDANVKRKTYALQGSLGLGQKEFGYGSYEGKVWDAVKEEWVNKKESISSHDRPGRSNDPYDLTVADEARILKIQPKRWAAILERASDIELEPYLKTLDDWYKDIGWGTTYGGGM